jgi:hypothetical protein
MRTDGRMDRQTDIKWLIFAFGDFVNESKINSKLWHFSGHVSSSTKQPAGRT